VAIDCIIYSSTPHLLRCVASLIPKCIDKLKVFITYQNMDRYNYSVILAIHIYMSNKETA